MKIGIDISQLAHEGTGVANYLQNLVQSLIEQDDKNEYILFFSSLRKKFPISSFDFAQDKNFQFPNKSQFPNSKIQIKTFKFPPTLLDILWNRLHIVPIEWLIGDIDVFITSDWVEPPTKKAKKATILYDLIVYKYPEEAHNKLNFSPFKMIISPNIVKSQKRKLRWVKKESSMVFCISDSTKQDVKRILGIEEERTRIIYPGA